MWGYYHAMLRSVFVIAMLAACHPAPAPTVVRTTPAAAAVHAPAPAPVRQDYELAVDLSPGPLHEVLATGHECRQERRGPIDDEPVPIDGRRLIITATPIACERHRDGQPVLH
jgi:hypothetical protein